MSLEILADVESCTENEIHGRLVQVLRLLECSGPLGLIEQESLHARIDALSASLLHQRHSFSVRATYLDIARVFTTLSALRSSALFDTVHLELDRSRSWASATAHLPSAENFVTALYLFALRYEPSTFLTLTSGLQSTFLSVQREALAHVESISTTSDGLTILETLTETLLSLALDENVGSECRILAIDLMAKATLELLSDPAAVCERLISRHTDTVIVPLKEALLPLIARLVSLVRYFPSCARKSLNRICRLEALFTSSHCCTSLIAHPLSMRSVQTDHKTMPD